jgi:plastocyanin
MKQLLMSVALALVTVHLHNDTFAPKTVTVHVGDTVRWINDDDDAHTVTATDGSFDSKGLDTNASWTHTFTKPGAYKYFCELHPFMKGTVVVKGGRS